MKTQYIWTQAQTKYGWGIIGVFDAAIIASCERTKEGIPIVSEDDLIVGQGSGWDSQLTYNEEWIKEACKRMSQPKQP